MYNYFFFLIPTLKGGERLTMILYKRRLFCYIVVFVQFFIIFCTCANLDNRTLPKNGDDCKSDVDCFHGAVCKKMVCVCDIDCSLEVMRVCASNGRFYTNECEMKREACKSQIDLFIQLDQYCDGARVPEIDCNETSCLFDGVCTTFENGDKKCLCNIDCKNFTGPPVCGSNRQMYQNECFLKNDSCYEQKAINQTNMDCCKLCPSIVIKNRVEQFNLLTDCTVIEGNLRILLLDYAKPEEYMSLRFPNLVEITDYLLMYRAYGLKTLRHIFPNLAVIRGQELFYNYALVAFEMPDLEELGLSSLTVIQRGAVRFNKSPNLCYLQTIDWTKITSLAPDSHSIVDNKDPRECVDQCPHGCKYCWNSKDCQNNIDCQCENGKGFCQLNGSCCHENCLGGCTGPTAKDCFACKNIYHDGECKKACPPLTYKFKNRRCLTEQECRSLKSPTWKLLDANMTANKTAICGRQCPAGYIEDIKDTNLCLKCKNRCPKSCPATVVNSITSVQTLKDCTEIHGGLILEHLTGLVARELEANLGQIEEVVGSIKISNADGLISLAFFRNLKVIHGETLENDRYALYVRDNENLENLFRPEVERELVIKRGKVFFHDNRRLCQHKIRQLMNYTNLNISAHTDRDISPSNGDRIPCQTKNLNLTVVMASSTLAILKWNKFEMDDSREMLGYVIYYREVADRNVTLFEKQDTCNENIWKTVQKQIKEENNSSEEFILLRNLKPWTLYAIYLKTDTLSTSKSTGMSSIEYFQTHPGVPTNPTNLKVTAKRIGELEVTWDPPHHPHGHVDHYLVYWQPEALNAEEYSIRDYCHNRIKPVEPTKKEEVKKKNETINGNCCECPKDKKISEIEKSERMMTIYFENFLQNNVFVKRDPEISPEVNDRPRRQKRNVEPADPHVAGKYLAAHNNQTQFNSTADLQPDPPFLAMTVYNSRSVVLTNLAHFQEYNIEVIACLKFDEKSKVCSNRAIATAKTLPLLEADNINASTVNATLIANGTGDMLITWEPPADANGLIVTYDVAYEKGVHKKNTRDKIVCVTQREYQRIKGCRLEKLDPGNYSYRVRATSLAAIGQWTEYKYFIVPKIPGKQQPFTSTIQILVIVFGVLLGVIFIGTTSACVRFKLDGRIRGAYVSVNPEYASAREVYEPDETEVDRDKIKLLRELGQGSFGMVYEGILIEDDGENGIKETKVAVKTAMSADRHSFLKEATVMKAFNCYHIVKLLGVVSVVSAGRPLVVMELMSNGDLKQFLRRHRPDDEDYDGRSPLTLSQTLRMAAEVADGMAYLTDKKYVHRDLAARNCMVSSDCVVKIGDFGMTRDIYETDYYRKGGNALLPVRWMAPESLKDGIYTSLSDVWSYGVVLWEMATLAAMPYQGLSNTEVVRFVSEGKIMEKPEGCPKRLYSLMLTCWSYKAKQRYTFKEIIKAMETDLSPSFAKISYYNSEENRRYMKEEEERNQQAEGERRVEGCEEQYKPLYKNISGSGDFYSEPNSSQSLSSTAEALELEIIPSESEPLASTSGHSSAAGISPSGDSCGLRRSSSTSSAALASASYDTEEETNKNDNSRILHKNGIANGHIQSQMTRTPVC
uniref:Tyrosine-protein kinase receptor n=1 Tax=Sepiella japonica TaxID=279094 RepID=A0A6B9RFK1_SEPJA|nr:insulin-like peptide receptor [Sepiella japonica]